MENAFRSMPEWWGGIECTINRVRNTYIDQLELSGHYEREGDLDLLSELGIKTLRYPLLWEKHQPLADHAIDWSWAERRLHQLRDLDISPIIGLVHHGSGPAFTDLLDPHFAEKLANYAELLIKKFPWVKQFTPVNEPLTTARFAGLYGLWHPHKKNATAFMRMFLNECKGIVLAMKRIRAINPEASLIQTEDLGKTYSTPLLGYQADFENERRWLTSDILCGKISRSHSLWEYLTWLKIPESELYWFIENPCVPDVLGFNYYITSERYLDENLHLYPNHTHGGNHKHKYADVEAIRIDHSISGGLNTLLKEAWDRYGLPLAVTEFHLNCTREQQLRWMQSGWNHAVMLRNEGVNIVAITAWALFGSFGWNNLLTAKEHPHYEPGVFDIRGKKPRLTAVGYFLRDIIKRSEPHPVCLEKGWWEMDNRFHCKNATHHEVNNNVTVSLNEVLRPLLITGKSGTLGNAFTRLCDQRGIAYHVTDREELDISDVVKINKAIEAYKPWAIVNTCGFVRVDEAELDAERCYAENTEAASTLAAVCKKAKVPLVSFSSDLVFDGLKTEPYVESDITGPLNIYGSSKAEAEQKILAVYPDSLIIRSSGFFGPWDIYNFAFQVLQSVKNQLPIAAAEDVLISPTYVPDLVNATLDLLLDGERGIWHIVNDSVISWADFARVITRLSDCDMNLVQGVTMDSFGYKARRPRYSALASEKGIILPQLHNAIDRFLKEMEFSVEYAADNNLVYEE
ncbi:MAG: sugar nucleotide-binding protein [Chitinophagales bacterium]|nr:sugar nucleotide-binding protein [Chitinophagales bacterium]